MINIKSTKSLPNQWLLKAVSTIPFIGTRWNTYSMGTILAFLITLIPSVSYAEPSSTGQPSRIEADMMRVTAKINSPGFDLSRKTVSPIIIYQHSSSMLAEISTQPTVHVFADGRVKVHQPAFLKQAGDYEYYLSQPELVQLIQSLSTDGLMAFDEQKVKQKRKERDQKAKNNGELHYISDATYTTIEVHLDNYQQTSSAKLQKQFSKQFHWKNLESDAKRYGDIAELQSAKQAIAKLNALKHHKRMKKVP